MFPKAIEFLGENRSDRLDLFSDLRGVVLRFERVEPLTIGAPQFLQNDSQTVIKDGTGPLKAVAGRENAIKPVANRVNAGLLEIAVVVVLSRDQMNGDVVELLDEVITLFVRELIRGKQFIQGSADSARTRPISRRRNASKAGKG